MTITTCPPPPHCLALLSIHQINGWTVLTYLTTLQACTDIKSYIYMYMLYNYIYIFIFIWWTYFIKLIIYNMHIICICLSFAPWFSSPTGTCWDIWGRIWGPHFRCRGHTGHSPAPLHHTRQRFFCFYHQSRRASFCWEKKRKHMEKLRGNMANKSGKN